MASSAEVELAWSDPDTARGWRRSWRTAWVLALAGVVLFAGFVLYIDRLYGHAEDLRANGATSWARVLDDPPETLRCTQVPIDIRFTANGKVVTHPFYDDSCGSTLQQGDTVLVSYDPDDPTDFIVGSDPNEEPGPTLLAIVALVGSVFLVGAAVIRVPRLIRLRRIFASCPWQDAPAVVAPLPSPWVRGCSAIRLLPAAPSTQPVDLVGSGGALGRGPTELRVAGPLGHRYAVQAAKGRPLLVRVPRWYRTIRRSKRSLAEVERRTNPDPGPA